jgi:hypothetical protein
MTTDDTARTAAFLVWIRSNPVSDDEAIFYAGYDAALRARPEPAGDRSALVQRFFLCRSRIVSLLTDMDECFQAAAPAKARPEPAWDWVEQLIGRITTEISELPDRTSHDVWPEAMLVTGEELATILRHHLAGALTPPPIVPDEVRRLLGEIFSTFWVDECQECAVGKTEAWKRLKEIITVPAQPGAGSHLTSVATTSGSSPLGVAPAQPAEDAERIARIERYREALSKLNRRIRELEGALQALSGKKGPSVLEMMIAERDRRIRELEEALRDVLHRALADEYLLSNEERNMVDHAFAVLQGDGK